MPEYPVKGPISINGKRHTDGTLEFEPEEARPLILCGALGEAVVSDGLEPGSLEPAHETLGPEAERKGKIIAAMEGMLASDPEQADGAKWTKGKTPDVGYLNQQLKDAEITIKAAERNTLWADLRK